MSQPIEQEALFELRFWMQILGDHCRFIVEALAESYLRANVHQFPALSRFHRQIELEMAIFQSFLHELEEMELNNEVLGVLSPLMADHMAREECYYLQKLAETTGEVKALACDPTKPRTQ